MRSLKCRLLRVSSTRIPYLSQKAAYALSLSCGVELRASIQAIVMNCDACCNLLTPQCKAALLTTPALTRVLLVVNIIIYVLGFLVPRDRSFLFPSPSITSNPFPSFASADEAPAHFCLSAQSVLGDSNQVSIALQKNAFFVFTDFQAYRIISAAFFHLSLMHITFNCMTLHNVGSVIEARTGTLSFALCTCILTPACGVMNLAASFLSNALGYDQSMKECAAGFSGVLFAYVTIQALHRDSAAYSIYGFFTVPAKWYPVCMLVITQILLPQSSFVGHLGGILAGAVYSVAESRLPSCLPCFTHLESMCSCPALSTRCFFIPYPAPPPAPPVRIIPGIIIGDNFHPYPSAPPQNSNLRPPGEAPADASQQSLPWLHRIQSLFPSRSAPSLPQLIIHVSSPRPRYQRLHDVPMQPLPHSSANVP